MNSYFDEKAQQVSPGELVAFGITLTSRYSKAGELSELLLFAQRAAAKDLHGLVVDAFYDSKACCCTFTLDRRVQLGSDEEQALRTAALATVRQFDWFGSVLHGADLADEG